jgi:hypothetical protein
MVPHFLVAAAAVAVLLGLELILRAVGYSSPGWYRPDPRLGWALRPGMSGWFTGEGKAFVQINSAGQRDREHRIDKPENVYRIAVLGDAFSEGMQVALDRTYWALLPELLASCGFQPGKRVEVLNFGVRGYSTAQAYLTLETSALRYRPDLVLLQFSNGNDVRDNSTRWTRKGMSVHSSCSTNRVGCGWTTRSHQPARMPAASRSAVRSLESWPSTGACCSSHAACATSPWWSAPTPAAPPMKQGWKPRCWRHRARRLGRRHGGLPKA